MTPPHVRPVATQVRQQCFGREIPFLQGVSEHCDSSGSQRALREGPFLIGRLGEVSDETAVPCQQGRQQRRQRLERVAEETPQERTLRAGLPATMAQDVLIVAAALFKCVSQDRHALEPPLVVEAVRQSDAGQRSPSRLDARRAER